MSFRHDRSLHFLLLTALAAAAVAPMVIFGIPGGNDAVQHYEFAQQVVGSLQAGDPFPSFGSNSNHGFGDAGLRVYPPAAYYLLASTYLLFGSWYWSSIAAFFLIFLGGAVGVYHWVGDSFSLTTAVTAAVIFTLMPFHLNEIYNNFLFAQFASGAVLPFCFLFTHRVIKQGRVTDSIGLAISIALLIVTHLPMTIIGSLALLVYAIFSLQFDRSRKLAQLTASVLAGLMLSSFYWVRVVTEMGWVKHSSAQYFDNRWSYSENFLLSMRTFTEFFDDELALWFGDIILAATVLFCIPALIYLFRKSETRSLLMPIVIVFGIAIVMTTPLSAVVWDNVTLLQKVQFPWRWLSIISLTGSAIAAVWFERVIGDSKTSKSASALCGVAAAALPFVFVSAFVVRAAHFTPKAEFESSSASFSAGETFEGWWPANARREAFSMSEKVVINGRDVNITEWKQLDRTFEIGAGDAGTATISTFYYPYWKGYINGLQTEVRPDRLGLISLDVPGEAVRVTLRFEEPATVKFAAWLSGLSWLAVIFGLAMIHLKRKTEHGTYR